MRCRCPHWRANWRSSARSWMCSTPRLQVSAAPLPSRFARRPGGSNESRRSLAWGEIQQPCPLAPASAGERDRVRGPAYPPHPSRFARRPLPARTRGEAIWPLRGRWKRGSRPNLARRPGGSNESRRSLAWGEIQQPCPLAPASAGVRDRVRDPAYPPSPVALRAPTSPRTAGRGEELPCSGGMPGENLTALVGGGLAAAVDQSRVGEFLSGQFAEIAQASEEVAVESCA